MIDRHPDRGDEEERPTVVVLQHSAGDPLGAMEKVLTDAARLEWVRGYADGPGATVLVDHLVATGSYDGVLGLGGPMGVYDIHDLPFLGESLRLLRDALARGTPILGLCLTSQMLAEVLGCQVFPGSQRCLPFEIGHHRLTATDAGRDDPVAAIFADGAPVMMWHGDTHDLPAGATLLASSEAYAVQAYRIRSDVYGLQFHPEADSEVVAIWVSESVPTGEISTELGKSLLTRARALDPVVKRRAEQLARLFVGWVEEYRTRSGRHGR